VSSQSVKAIYAQMLQDLRAYFREMNVGERSPNSSITPPGWRFDGCMRFLS
jgi:hypothetical protein